jgi:membrane fusion protein, copper/silver efflux system
MSRRALSITLLLAASACAKPTPPPASPPPPGVAPVVEAARPPPDSLDLAGAYETIRAGLAADASTGLAPYAQRVSALSKGQAAVEAASLALVVELQSADIEKQRVAFGELSKAFVGWMMADVSRQTGKFLFECPMAKGYQKWVQSSEKLQNPYMGKKMLECGSRLDKWAI